MDRSRRWQADGVAAEPADLTDSFEFLRDYARRISDDSLPASQFRALVVLDHHEGINLSSLAELLGTTPPLASRLCDRLQASGFVERTLSKHSGRELSLCLSDRGRAHLNRVRARRKKHIAEALAALPPETREALFAGLTAFHAAARRERRISS
ncbi:MarR family winged helix-turn-helix transcriptional regulator [Amycolatopsis sp. lyj-23]|uniref:MarR family winged helix-turn-helix transcriptional regulator n=1 Tax=Amycolatopsis sp. lyj-23 TaxID=2789283 RepID=UPI003979CA7D